MISRYDEVWLVDFEYSQPTGEQPEPICMVAFELLSNRWVRLGPPELVPGSAAPYALSERALFVAYGAVAELRCHLALGWDLPASVLDLHAEFRISTNGLVDAHGSGLLAACHHFGVPTVNAGLKDEMRDLAMRGGVYMPDEISVLMDYCQTDVVATVALYRSMEAKIDLDRALIRGGYLRALSVVESRGLPIDVRSFESFKSHWPELRTSLIKELDATTGVYCDTSFSTVAFACWLTERASLGLAHPKVG